MTGARPGAGPDRRAAPTEPTDTAVRRGGFVRRSVVGLVLAALAGLAFLGLLALVAGRWAPLAELDQAVVETVNAAVRDDPRVVAALQLLTSLGDSAVAWVLWGTTAAWLLVRGRPGLALFVVVSGAGAAILTHGIKEAVDRVRPVLDLPVATAAGNSFPSGHALTATVLYGVLALVFLPAVPQRWRRWVIGTAVALAVLVGLTRVALGVHFPSDVVGGWLVGVLWLLAATTAFRRSFTAMSARRAMGQGADPTGRAAATPAPAHDHPLPPGRHAGATLSVAAVLIWGALVGLGFLVTSWSAVQDVDEAVMSWVQGVRTDWLTQVLAVAGRLGSTPVILGVVVVTAALALAITRRWRPAVLVVAAAVGETLLFLATQAVVDRDRPPLDDLATGASSVSPAGSGPASQLLQTSSFPSGHVAAALATYGAVAMLCWWWGRRACRQAVAVLAALAVLAVAVSRVYLGVHYLTDVLASVLLASGWLSACWFVLVREDDDEPPSSAETGPREAVEPLRRARR